MQETPKSSRPISKKPPLPPQIPAPTTTTTAPPRSNPTPATIPAKPPAGTIPPANRRIILPSSLDQSKNNKASPKRRKFCRFMCSSLFAVLTILIVVISAAAGMFYLWFDPKPPVFKLRPVQFNRFSVSTGSDGTGYVDSGVNVWLEVKNPNEKLDLYYGGARADVSCADVDVELGTASQREFAQGTGNVTVLKFVTGGGKMAVDEETGKRLNGTVKSGMVRVTVAVKTKVGVGFGKWRVGMMMPVDVACGGVSLKRIKEGGPVKCKISWFSWG